MVEGAIPKPKYRRDGTGFHTQRKMVNAKVRTYCDFGEEGRKTEIGQHLTIATAMRQYAWLWDIYGRRPGYKVWQEEVKDDNG